jgi:TetR/AcrR family transcriptional regulator, transcriptional repressor of bet genes
MARPSLAEVRREQILDAVVETILERGVDGTTVSAVAQRLGMQPSHVRHYLGTHADMMRAAVERALANVELVVVHSLPTKGRLHAQLDVIFGGGVDRADINQLVDELIAASYRDDELRPLVAAMYRRFATTLRDTLKTSHPTASAAQRRRVAHGILALAHAQATFHALGFDRSNSTHLRAAADVLVAQLD